MGFAKVFALIIGVLLLPPATYALTSWWGSKCSANKAVTRQWSDDKAFEAVLNVSHCPSGWMTPSSDDYSVQIIASADRQVPPQWNRAGWSLTLPFSGDEVDEGPVTIDWPSRRELAITIFSHTIQGMLTRTEQDLAIKMTYKRRAVDATGSGS